MKKLIKIISAVMCVLCICLIFASCSEQKSEDENTQDGVMSSFNAKDIKSSSPTNCNDKV